MNQPYPTYKESHVEWIGPVPSNWSIERMGSLFEQAAQQGCDDLPVLSVSIHSGVTDEEIDPDNMDRMVARSEDRSKYKTVKPGDLVYNMMRAWQGGFGAVSVDGMVSPAYVVARPRPETSFLTSHIEALLRTPHAVEEMRRQSHGVTDFRLRLYWDEFKNIKIALPPLSEQKAIAAFLDRETGRIDTLVAEQRRLIELLKEKRQAVISHAVTKGLDATAPMKPSGIEWLGDIPAHWRVLPMKHLVGAIEQGWSPQCEARPAEDGEWGVLKVGCVNGGTFRPDENKSLPEELSPRPDLTLRRNDLLISRANTRELVGSTSVVEGDFPRLMISDKLYRLRCRPDAADPIFLALFMCTSFARERVELEANGASASMLNIAQSTIRELPVPVPPVKEQTLIAETVRMELEQLDDLTGEVEHSISLLQERRNALISAAVTGKIDVRGLVPDSAQAVAA